jgi:uncharacterized protein
MVAVELNYKLLPELAEIGASADLEGVLALGKITKGALDFELDDGISYSINLSNTGRGVLLTGRAFIEGTSECSRCLEPARVEVEGEVVGYYILNPGEEDEELADDEFFTVDSTGVVDLVIPIVAAIIHELPQVVLCDEDCAGLCPHCGVNLNEETCGCADEPPADSPFAVLSQFKN